jgi:hypothetical protein
MKTLVLLLSALAFVGCASDGPIPEPPGGSVPVSPATSLNFYARRANSTNI